MPEFNEADYTTKHWHMEYYAEEMWRRVFVDNGVIRDGGWEIGYAQSSEANTEALAIVNLDSGGTTYFSYEHIAPWGK